ncbi:MAG: orotate phosphoribosyltransferase [Alyxoria varia]|nr:MAG: orotate phosphoribosyltransferase [Alyxoria varia]
MPTAASGLPQWKANFLEACTRAEALTFGDYKLKSGRISPYFFNAGKFHKAHLFDALSTAFGHTLASYEPKLSLNVLFGPAFKGIPLASAAVIKLAGIDQERFGEVSYSFNRKEKKEYGDGGSLVGASLKGQRVVIIDDVITAGTAIREAIDIIQREGGTLVGIVIAVDRMEKIPSDDDDKPGPSTIGEVRRQYGVPVMAILTLDDIIEGLRSTGNEEDFKRVEEYRAKYGATD